jgi:hypothetical protein
VFGPTRATAVLVGAGALGVAFTTALEVVTAPYSPAVAAYGLNPAVHVVKVVAAAVVVVGLVRFAAELGRSGTRVGALAAGLLALATVLGAVPYSVAEATLDADLSPAAAAARLEAIYAGHGWIAVLASIAIPLVLVGIVALAVVALRRRLVAPWAPVAGLVAIPLAVLAGVLGEAGMAVPHPPAWLFLGIAAFGPALHRVRSGAPVRRPVAA